MDRFGEELKQVRKDLVELKEARIETSASLQRIVQKQEDQDRRFDDVVKRLESLTGYIIDQARQSR